MSVAARLASFALALVAIFGAAVAVGDAVGPQRDGTAAPPTHGMAMGAHGTPEHGAAIQAVRGLAVTSDGLSLELAQRASARGERLALDFRIAGPDGRTVRAFDVEHTKRMHFIVVRRDLTGFQHLHPEQAPDGTWTVPLTLRDAGVYRVFADFTTDGKARTLATDLTVDGSVRSGELPAPVDSLVVDGLRVRLQKSASRAGAESELSFTVSRDGQPVPVENYLGAKGHLVALRQGDLAFLHVHPDQSSLRFAATFPTAGFYRLFLQFQTDGRVHTAAFTQEVTR